MRLSKLIRRQMKAGKRLADYFLAGCAGEGWPKEIILAVCAARWPDRTWRIDQGQQDDSGFYTPAAASDIDTGESAEELYLMEDDRLLTLEERCRSLSNKQADAGR